MKNEEITIYELMGLIKDGKASYEIIYNKSKYFIDELEGYYKKEDGTPLFEHIFDNYNDYDALQEKIEILPEENEMKEMVYQKEQTREILYNGIYKDYEFYILNLGTYPTAYVNVINNNLLAMKNYNDIDIDVHGGLTYSENHLKINNENKEVKGWFIGWDYAHYNDYHGYLNSTYPEYYKQTEKKWTTEEIFEDVKSVIEQCINYQENDEWEDIEELCNLKTHEYNTTSVQANRIAINQLIKNQKYLKERLDKNE